MKAARVMSTSGHGQQVPPPAGQAHGSGVETHTWAVVLAGGRGVRLSGLTRHVYGEDRPKQYAALTGGKSLRRLLRVRDPRHASSVRLGLAELGATSRRQRRHG